MGKGIVNLRLATDFSQQQVSRIQRNRLKMIRGKCLTAAKRLMLESNRRNYRSKSPFRLSLNCTRLLNLSSDLVNENILPLPKSKTNERLHLARTNARSYSFAKDCIRKSPMQKNEMCAYRSRKTKHSHTTLDKPLFLISTRNKRPLNKRSAMGALIKSIQTKLPPLLYKANRGDSTCSEPQEVRSLVKHYLNQRELLKPGNVRTGEFCVVLRRREPCA
eukprot:TRINITY_DN14041_c0_g5_i1.p1 TRINITY_DN14041_c0_g5~~TRINITY_DN14041_c0_g5_i1.p1  ORF type:complete len:219 (+),score=32.63 TRINITY_DN14041_c0_g5_i1:95-751(+)